MPRSLQIDVLIIGAGPSGLLLACMLERLGIRTLVAEKNDTPELGEDFTPLTLFPRSLEMLEQVELLDDLKKVGETIAQRDEFEFLDDEPLASGAWPRVFEIMKGTSLNYCLQIPHTFALDTLRAVYNQETDNSWIGFELESFSILPEENQQGNKVVAKITSPETKTSLNIVAKYLIGADGPTSKVRELAKVSFVQQQECRYHWIRIDGVFETNMPDAGLDFAVIESENYGNVLWFRLNNGTDSLVFLLKDEMRANYGDSINFDNAMAVAIQAMQPYTLNIKSVTSWKVGEKQYLMSQSFSMHERVFLVGDAAHNFVGQPSPGMNFCVHDAFNLAWKLAGMIKGWYNKEVLETYEVERCWAAGFLLGVDKMFFGVFSRETSDEIRAGGGSIRRLYDMYFLHSANFSVGLAFEFGDNVLIKASLEGSSLLAGARAPDAMVYPPGSTGPVRLFELNKYTGQWSIMLFTGPFEKTTIAPIVRGLAHLERVLPKKMVQILILIADKQLTSPPPMEFNVGSLFYDPDSSVHKEYRLLPQKGAIVVVRPDGLLGYATTLEKSNSIIPYLNGFTHFLSRY